MAFTDLHEGILGLFAEFSSETVSWEHLRQGQGEQGFSKAGSWATGGADAPPRDPDRGKRYYADHAEQEQARLKAWAAANPERVRECSAARQRAYQKRHPERARAAAKRWKQNNPEKYQAQLQRARDRRRAARLAVAEGARDGDVVDGSLKGA